MKDIRHFESMYEKKRSPINFLTFNTFKLIISVTFLVTVFSQTALADDKTDVENLLKERIDNIVAALENKDLANEIKEEKIENIIKPIINFPLMSMLVLGKEAWTSLPEKDQKRFVELFAKTIKQTLINKILNFVDEKVIIETSDLVSNKKVNVSISIVSKDKNIPILFKFYRSGNEWNIYDVEIEGVSILKNFKAQFTDSLQDMTAQELIVKMEKSDSSK